MKKDIKIVLILLLVAISAITWYASYGRGLVTIYNDSMGHLDVARSVIDGKQPGLAQFGSVWLPFDHILFLSLIWNNWAWHSGFAGSFFSMLAYIFGAIGIYLIIKELTKNVVAAIVGAMAFALNPNLLYLQTTPLTEPLYVVLFIFSVLFFIKFTKTDDLQYLLLMGIFGMLQVLTRYDGWFVVFIEGIALICQQMFVSKKSFQETLGKVFVFATPVVFGIALWITWNALIFGNPLYFLFGPNSAHAQQVVIQHSDGLIAKGNLGMAFLAYWYAVSSDIGNYIIILACGGVVLFLAAKKGMRGVFGEILLVGIFLAPVIFNIIALYLGFSIINLPQLHWTPPSNVGQYFNVRYGILALPLVAVFVGLLASKSRKKLILLLVVAVVLIQSWSIYHQGLITVAEGTTGSNTAAYGDAGSILAAQVKPGENILISDSLYSAVIFRSGFPMKDFITEGVNAEWSKALAAPQAYADWVVMGNQDLNDPIYVALYENNSAGFLKEYKNIYCNPELCIYEKKTPAEMFVYASSTNLQVNGKNITIKGVNDYDLAYKSKPQIDATFKNLNQIGVNTVRFWLFGDGNPNGFQAPAGVMNESRLENADYVIADAAKYHIRLIPVLLNNWTDYGGIPQYLQWVGQPPSNQDAFYTDPKAISLFENYIDHVIPRKNTITGISYNNDPTILAWEVVNEPRFSSADTQAFENWFSTISGYIRKEDGNHMITLETDTTSFNSNGAPVIQDLCARLSVDFCTAHLYLYNNNVALYKSWGAVESNIKQYQSIVAADNKPFLFGEVGISKDTAPFGIQPLAALRTILSYNHSSGALIWNWSDMPDTSFGFSPLGTNGVYSLKDLSLVFGGKKPSTAYFSPISANDSGYNVSTPEVGSPSSSLPAIVATAVPAVVSISPLIPASIPIEIPTPSSTATSSAENVIVPPPPPAIVPPPQTPQPSPAVRISLPYVGTDSKNIDWSDGWGASSAADGVVTVGSNASTTSGAIFLNGSNGWTNYILTADVRWVKGDLFTVIARRTDDSNLIDCVFSNIDTSILQMSINRVFGGQSIFMGTSASYINNAAHIPEGDIKISIKVNGIGVQCSIDGAMVNTNLNNGLQPILMAGGIGFETWDAKAGNSGIVVSNINVTPL